MLSTIFASALALAASVSALTPANTANPPSGNPIGHPGLGELIPAGKSFEITWTPTDPSDKISLLLLHGPSTNAVPILTIADSIDNTGSFAWSVPSTLEPDTTNYAIELVVEGTGAYQYSPQCGVSNPGFSGSSSGDSGVKSNDAGSTTSGSSNSSAASTTTLTASAFSKPTGVTTGTGNFSAPIVSPTKSITKPVSLETETSTFSQTAAATTQVNETPSPTQSQASASSSGAAIREKASVAGLAIAGLVGVLVL